MNERKRERESKVERKRMQSREREEREEETSLGLIEVVLDTFGGRSLMSLLTCILSPSHHGLASE